VHHPKNNEYSQYAASIEAKFATSSTTPAPIPVDNAWKRRNKRPPILTYDDSEFPELSPSRKPSPAKKSRNLDNDDLTQTTAADTTAIQEELNKMQTHFESLLEQTNTKHESDMAAQNQAIGKLQHLHIAQVQQSNIAAAKLDALASMMIQMYSAQMKGEQLQALPTELTNILVTPIPSTDSLHQQIQAQVNNNMNSHPHNAGSPTGAAGMQS